MWGTFLSEPLLIEALVGRYPASWLIRRIPIPVLRHFTELPCDCSANRALILVSKGYSRDRGRLDTRYSPIRRSTPGKAETPPSFPLDLHVLSL